MKNVENKSSETTYQEFCIDLPGENVQCWRSSDNIKVILRKHRDIIFDIELKKGDKYTVHSTESDFYNARDKKLVIGREKERIQFTDGERMHLWVTRVFKGSIVLMQGDKILMKVAPNDLDMHRYDNDPKTKPAPIVISLGKSVPEKSNIVAQRNNSMGSTLKNTVVKSNINITKQLPAAVPADVDCPVACIIEGSAVGIPEKIKKSLEFNSGGGHSGLVDIDPNDVATRNWIWGQAAGTAAFVAENWLWLKSSLDSRTHKGFQLVRVKVGYTRTGLVRFVFVGYSKFNAVFRQGLYGPKNGKMMTIFAGAGTTKSSFLAMTKNAIGSFKGFAGISLIFSSATAYAEWQSDVSKDGYDFAAALIMSIIKTVVVAVLVSVLVASIVTLVIIGAAVEVPVILIGAISIVGGVVIGYYTDAADKKIGKLAVNDVNEDGIAATFAPALRSAGEKVNKSWNYLMDKFPKDYQWIQF